MKRIVIILFILLIVLPAAFLGYFYFQVTREAADRIERGAIDRVIASESPVYYSDGHTPIGVFFEKTHRKYIRYEGIPRVFVKALIAAEDRNFFEHAGFDIKAIIRAFMANMKTGQVVQGGSTITQQTAKNIFKREKRSYRTKLKEVMQAFLLESRYTKEEILEMYANQFFVTGYGKGLRIAAQYFFGKDPKDLDLVETAFIVGSLKGPNKYNPFIKKTRAQEDEARRLAKERKDYVVGRMLSLNFISEAQYREARAREVPFREGKITYRLNVVMDYVRNQLESDYFREILRDQGVENIATSGISIYTSVDREVQQAALISLRNHLPLMDVMLNGYRPGEQGERWKRLLQNLPFKPEENLPFLARITSVDTGRDQDRLMVAWDNGEGVIDFEGLKPVGSAWLKANVGTWAAFKREHVPLLLKIFRVGDQVPVRLMESEKTGSGEKAGTRLILYALPELEGGIVVLQQGMIRAMVGGFLDRYFNRAVDAKRQLGSIFKPIVYGAALQLKWNILDPLENRRDIFRFEGTSYLPRPDHEPESHRVSMAWAGAKSENLATVWLLYHLTDHLNPGQFREVAGLVGLLRKDGETYQAYKSRIRDKYGVIVNRRALMEAAFYEAIGQMKTDLIFEGHEGILADLHRLHFDLPEGTPVSLKAETRVIMRYDFQRLRRLERQMKDRFQALIRIIREEGGQGQTRIPAGLLKGFFLTGEPGEESRIVYTDDPEYLDQSALIPLSAEGFAERAKDPGMEGQVWIDDLIPAGVLDSIEARIRSNYRELLTHERYSFQVLSRIRDFRTLVNLSFVVYLSKKIGIVTPLDPVLSFPLGPNAISIMEAALAYETLATGMTYPLAPKGGPAMVPIITKIVDREGELIWEYEPRPRRVLSRRVSTLLTEILAKVMERGTGHKARDAVRLFNVPVPTFGKTGTANRFTNSSFVGLIPAPDPGTGRLDLQRGYVIAAYAGYDDNRSMKGEHLAIYGSSGALPLWIDTANAVVNTAGFKDCLQPADLAFSPLAHTVEAPGGFRRIPVSPVTGLPVDPAGGNISSPLVTVLTEAKGEGDNLKLERAFEPVRPDF
ncbi:MAG: transglycosylase domain-containing protein [Deltaproteobacteria bacterium]|nr:transglycosylase domain-containing protein [Deltaproteobacteria bacterium]